MFRVCDLPDCKNGVQKQCSSCGRYVCGVCICNHGAADASSMSSSTNTRGGSKRGQRRTMEDDEGDKNDDEDDEDQGPSELRPLVFSDPVEMFKIATSLSDGQIDQINATVGDELANCEGLIQRADRLKQDLIFAKNPAGTSMVYAIPDQAKSHSILHKVFHSEEFQSDEEYSYPTGRRYADLSDRIEELCTRTSFETFRKGLAFWHRGLTSAYTESVTLDAFHKSGVCRKELLGRYLAGEIPNPCDARFTLSKCPKFAELEQVDADYLLSKMPDFKRIMGEALEIDETEFNAVIDSEENPAVAEATAASRKAHLQSLNNLAISRRRFMILSMVALEKMEMKRRRKEEEAAEKEKLRLEEAAEKEKLGVPGKSSVPILAFARLGNVRKITPGYSARSVQRCSAHLASKWSVHMKGFASVAAQNNKKQPTVTMIKPFDHCPST